MGGIASGSKLPDILTVQVWMKPAYDDAMTGICLLDALVNESKEANPPEKSEEKSYFA